MRCPRCNHRIRGASWYCPSCGTPVESLNVADLLAPRRRWAAWLLGLTAMVTVTGLGLMIVNRGDRPGGADGVAEQAGAAGEASGSGSGASGEQSTATEVVPVGAGAPPAAAPSPVPMSSIASEAEVEPAGASPAPTPRVRAGNPVWQASYMPRSPNIDGQLDDQRGTPVEFASVVFGLEHWEGGGDLSGRMLLGWNSQALFVAVRVFDDVFSQPSSGDRLHLGDSLELQLDMDLYGDWDRSTYDIDDWQIGLSPGDFEERGPEWWVWRPGNAGLNLETNIEVAAARLPDGYSVEAAIPWAVLETRPVGGMAVGMSLNVSDNDSPEPAQLTMIASSPSRSWSDPRSFGTVVLEGGPAR